MLYDVIIAGAGPAGSTCARVCAAAGIRTLLLERDTFPRPKPCGGAVSDRTLALLGVSLPPELMEHECFGARLHFRGRTVEVRKDLRIAVIVDRERFDRFLAELAVRAGAVLREGEPVREVSSGREYVEVRTDRERYMARCVVGADGANSTVGRTVRPQFPRDEIAVALVGETPAGDREIGDRLGGLLEMHFGLARMGYGWVFPHRGRYGVGIMGQASRFMDPGKAFRDFTASVGLTAGRPRGHTIPWGGIPRTIIGPRTVLVGDAAGLADPFHGEGIHNAVLSGRLAARAIADGISGTREPLTRYARESDRLIVREMRIALWMARMLDRHPDLFTEIFFSDEKALTRYLDIPAGKADYRQFGRWLLMRTPGALAKILLGGIPARR